MEGQLLCERYELRERRRSGGAGAAWTAYDREDGRTVVVTVLADLATAPADAERAERAARAAAGLPSHPHLAPAGEVVHDDASGTVFTVTGPPAGRTLEDVLAVDGPPDAARAVEWAAQVCAGLAAAHAAGVVHGRIRPAAVEVGADGAVRVLGLGTSVPATPGTVPGTAPGAPEADTALTDVPWMSPEQVRGGPADHRSDLYAVGCLLHQLLTGVTPFGHREATVQFGAHLRETPQPPGAQRPGLPPGLDALVLRLLAKAPEERPAGAQEAGAALTALKDRAGETATGFPVAAVAAVVPQAAPPTPGGSPFDAFETVDAWEPEPWWQRRSGRHTGTVAAGAALALVVVAGLTWAIGSAGGRADDGARTAAEAAASASASGLPSDAAVPPFPSPDGSVPLPGGSTAASSPGADASASTGPSATGPATAPGASPGAPQPTGGATAGGTGTAARPTAATTTARPATTTPPAKVPPSPGTGAATYGCSGGLVGSYPVRTSAGVVFGYFYIWYDNASGKNCAATIKTSNSGYGSKSAVSASISRCSNTAAAASCTKVAGTTSTDSGSFTMYAGPVKVAAVKTCITGYGSITWGGVTATTSGSLGNRAVHCG